MSLNTDADAIAALRRRGPLVGGLLVTASWRWIFTINVPIGLIAILIGWRILPRVPGHEAPRPNLWAALLVLRSPNPFVAPALFSVRPFTGATLVFAAFGAAFGAMLLSIALWQQTAWQWSALKTGPAIAPGPLLVPITSLFFAGKLIGRFGAAAVATAGALFFAAGPLLWATR